MAIKSTKQKNTQGGRKNVNEITKEVGNRGTHVNFNIKTYQRPDGNITADLSIMTPLQVVVLTYGYSEDEFNMLVETLREGFQYVEGELVPLRVPTHDFNCILIVDKDNSTKEYGKYCEDGSWEDGHELQLAKSIVSITNKMNDEDDNYRVVGQVSWDSVEVDLLKDECDYLQNITTENKNNVHRATINLSNMKLEIVLSENSKTKKK